MIEMAGKRKKEGKKSFIRNMKIWLLKIMCKYTEYKLVVHLCVLLFGVIFQIFFANWIIACLGNKRYEYLKTLSLMLGMASTIGLSTIVVFGFNLGKSVQQFWRGVIKEHGLNNLNRFLMPEVKVDYWFLIVLIFLYLCIAMDWCTLFYILIIYDVLCYIVLITKLWLIENVGDQYLRDSYERKGKEEKEEELSRILQNCVEDDGKFNIGAIKTYIEWLDIYLKKENKREKSSFDIEELYKNVRHLFDSTMEKLAVDRVTHTCLLLTIIREFCKKELQDDNRLKEKVILAAMITYSLDREKDIDINIIYKEIINWNDKSEELRYCIAVARLEYLYTVSGVDNRILLNDNIFYLYQWKQVNKSYEEIICLLWYLWSQEDGIPFSSCVEQMCYFGLVFQQNLKVDNIVEAGDSFYTLVRGMKY